MIVVDANVMVYVWVSGPHTDLALRARDRDPVWVAPSLWRNELRNALTSHIRHAGLPLGEAIRIADEAEASVSQTYHVAAAEVLTCAARSRRSAYHCEYVALARGLRVPLVTADRALASSFPEICVSLEAFTE